MDYKVHLGMVASLRRQAWFFRGLAASLACALVFLSMAVFALGKAKERIVIVPPEINAKFWVEDEQVSQRYFLEWGHYLASLLLNVSAAGVDYQNAVLLRHVAPERRAVFRRRLDLATEHLQQEKLSTFFNVADVLVEPEQARVAFVGTLHSYVEGRRIGEREAAYMLAFRVRGGHLQLLEMVETRTDAAFVPLTQ